MPGSAIRRRQPQQTHARRRRSGYNQYFSAARLATADTVDMKLHVATLLALLLAAFLSCGGGAPRPDPRWLCERLRCPPTVSPVCGVDDTGEFRTFRTACHMELALCHEKKYFVMLKPGEC